ncbi:Egt2p KNAG_0K02580 [Huiozyma naganishii CBS 8797]|uniref:Flo11 domain-containing protein n=1 Tax=Huiozyma naganishii (strain ATCC MYA-139 / BCRC 22969 / CBS 8797 / KCTC 17520 / NBRC 10181 / NCYC 3082 / Yp74L-3) TaxID=1071383 RepID=J7SB04_HUIN7|nr:hypothetical protein KNAG_0K02580 [Kazachstania naganishii CBS 8797]CCK72621.1 hypothetical protein KNAG_0K02580 [Kazachstania naganishii CBS 8797]
MFPLFILLVGILSWTVSATPEAFFASIQVKDAYTKSNNCTDLSHWFMIEAEMFLSKGSHDDFFFTVPKDFGSFPPTPFDIQDTDGKVMGQVFQNINSNNTFGVHISENLSSNSSAVFNFLAKLSAGAKSMISSPKNVSYHFNTSGFNTFVSTINYIPKDLTTLTTNGGSFASNKTAWFTADIPIKLLQDPIIFSSAKSGSNDFSFDTKATKFEVVVKTDLFGNPLKVVPFTAFTDHSTESKIQIAIDTKFNGGKYVRITYLTKPLTKTPISNSVSLQKTNDNSLKKRSDNAEVASVYDSAVANVLDTTPSAASDSLVDPADATATSGVRPPFGYSNHSDATLSATVSSSEASSALANNVASFSVPSSAVLSSSFLSSESQRAEPSISTAIKTSSVSQPTTSSFVSTLVSHPITVSPVSSDLTSASYSTASVLSLESAIAAASSSSTEETLVSSFSATLSKPSSSITTSSVSSSNTLNGLATLEISSNSTTAVPMLPDNAYDPYLLSLAAQTNGTLSSISLPSSTPMNGVLSVANTTTTAPVTVLSSSNNSSSQTVSRSASITTGTTKNASSVHGLATPTVSGHTNETASSYELITTTESGVLTTFGSWVAIATLSHSNLTISASKPTNGAAANEMVRSTVSTVSSHSHKNATTETSSKFLISLPHPTTTKPNGKQNKTVIDVSSTGLSKQIFAMTQGEIDLFATDLVPVATLKKITTGKIYSTETIESVNTASINAQLRVSTDLFPVSTLKNGTVVTLVSTHVTKNVNCSTASPIKSGFTEVVPVSTLKTVVTSCSTDVSTQVSASTKDKVVSNTKELVPVSTLKGKTVTVSCSTSERNTKTLSKEKKSVAVTVPHKESKTTSTLSPHLTKTKPEAEKNTNTAVTPTTTLGIKSKTVGAEPKVKTLCPTCSTKSTTSTTSQNNLAKTTPQMVSVSSSQLVNGHKSTGAQSTSGLVSSATHTAPIVATYEAKAHHLKSGLTAVLAVMLGLAF